MKWDGASRWLQKNVDRQGKHVLVVGGQAEQNLNGQAEQNADKVIANIDWDENWN